MAAPTVTVPTTGTDPKIATKEGLESQINSALEQNYESIEAQKALIAGKTPLALSGAGGTGDAVTANFPAGLTITAISVGQLVHWAQPAENTGSAPTLTVGGNAYTLYNRAGSALEKGELKTGILIGRCVDTDKIRVLGALNADDLVEGETNLFLTEVERNQVSQSSAIAPDIDDWAWVLTDDLFRPVVGEKLDGSIWKAREGVLYQVGGGTFTSKAPSLDEWLRVETDSDDKPVFGQGRTGQMFATVEGVAIPLLSEGAAGRNEPRGYQIATSGLYYLSEDEAANVDHMILVIGQSLAEGTNTEVTDTTVTTAPEHPGFALMPKGGNGRYRTVFADYEDLYEIPLSTTASKETICSGMADALMRRFDAELGFKPRMVFGVSALGGSSYAALKIGSETYLGALEIATRCREISAKAGRRLIISGVVVVHGEQDEVALDTTTEEYARALDNWERTLGDDLMRATGQAQRPRWYLIQTSYADQQSATYVPKIPVAQMQAADRNPNLCLIGPAYFQVNSGDNAHPDCRSYRRIGGMVGNALADDLYGPFHTPLKIVDAWQVDATTFRARFSMDVALETDDSRVTISTLGAGKGLNFDDGSGSPPSVTGISVVGGSGDTLEFTLSGAPTGYRRRILVANEATGPVSGNVSGIRSGIRSAASFDTDPQDTYAHYWWASIQKFDI